MKTANKQGKIGYGYGAAIAAGMLAAALVISSGKAQADEPAPVCNALIMATVNHGPAMQPVQISIWRNGKLITSTTRHSLETQLDCGKGYRAVLTLDSLTRSRTFEATLETNVVVEMES